VRTKIDVGEKKMKNDESSDMLKYVEQLGIIYRLVQTQEAFL
jgi:hypothetical protein